MRGLRVALLGLGYWGVNYLRVLQELEDVELVGCADLSSECVERLRLQHPHLRFSSCPDELLGDSRVDAVVIATPASTHAPVARAALLAGKHVLVEKPIAIAARDAETLGSLAAERSLTCMVAHTFLYNPAILEARRRIASGELGRIYYMNLTRTSFGPIRQDVDVLWDLVPHDVSIALHLLGAEPIDVSASGSAFLREGMNDLVFLTLRFGSGTVAHIHASWLDPRKKREVTVVGSSGMLVVEDTSPDRKLAIFQPGGEVVPDIETWEPLRKQCEHFVDCVAYGKRPLTDAESGARVVRILEQAQAQLGSP